MQMETTAVSPIAGNTGVLSFRWMRGIFNLTRKYVILTLQFGTIKPFSNSVSGLLRYIELNGLPSFLLHHSHSFWRLALHLRHIESKLIGFD